MRKAILASSVLVGFLVLCGATGAERSMPRIADFVAPGDRIYFSGTEKPQYWGDEVAGWHLGVSPLGELHYVETGGRGEEIRLVLHLFSKDPVFDHWEDFKSFRFTITLSAEGLHDFASIQTLKSESASSGKSGSCRWISAEIPLNDAQQFWGRLPPVVSISATLTQPGLPAPSSSAMALKLTPLTKEQATWSQRVESVRPGQSRPQVEALLGAPVSEHSSILVYPNPDLSPDLPPRLRTSEIFMDPQGHVTARYVMAMHC